MSHNPIVGLNIYALICLSVCFVCTLDNIYLTHILLLRDFLSALFKLHP